MFEGFDVPDATDASTEGESSDFFMDLRLINNQKAQARGMPVDSWRLSRELTRELMIGLERERRGLWRLDQLQSQEIGRFSRVIHPPATSSEEGVRLACVRPAASVRSERGSNSQV